MGELKGSEFYDVEFARQDHYTRHYSISRYIPVWNEVNVLLEQAQAVKILELGCGPGQLAHMLADDGFQIYKGIDFSVVAVQMAEERLKNYTGFEFEVCDFFNKGFKIKSKYDTVIAIEVLEHIKDDLALIKKIPKDTNIIFSVPCFDARAHVRYFKDINDTVERYKNLINIDIVRKITLESTDDKFRQIILLRGVKI